MVFAACSNISSTACPTPSPTLSIAGTVPGPLVTPPASSAVSLRIAPDATAPTAEVGQFQGAHSTNDETAPTAVLGQLWGAQAMKERAAHRTHRRGRTVLGSASSGRRRPEAKTEFGQFWRTHCQARRLWFSADNCKVREEPDSTLDAPIRKDLKCISRVPISPMP